MNLRALLLVAVLVGATSAAGDSGVSTGTLTLTIIGRQGCVTATDSRGTFTRRSLRGPGIAIDESPQDDQQKLFRTGSHSAVAIAGLASATYGQFDAAAALREEYGNTGIADSRGGSLGVGMWLGRIFRQELRRIVALQYATNPPKEVAFVATVCAWEGGPQYRILEFVPSDVRRGSRGRRILLMTVTEGPPFKYITLGGGNDLRWVAVGIRDRAVPILQGQLPDSTSPAIGRYNAALRAGNEGSLRAADLIALARDIFKDTVANSRDRTKVGGPVQLAAFLSDGGVIWSGHQKTPPPTGVTLYRRDLNIGGVMDGTTAIKPPAYWSSADAFNQPMEEPFRQIHIDREFRNAIIPLDGNIYVGCRFKNCTFEYRRASEWPEDPDWLFDNSNRLMGCTIRTPAPSLSPRALALFSRCRVRTNSRVSLSPPVSQAAYTLVTGP